MAAITVKELDALTPVDVGRVIRDGGGLSGRVRGNTYATGGVSVTFTYRYRWEGKTKDEPCGSWPRDRITVIRAARDKIRQLIDAGIDPAEHRKAAQLKVQADAAEQRRRLADEQAQEMARQAETERMNRRLTVRQLFGRWSEIELSGRRDGGAETKRGLEKDILSALGNRYADEITRADIMAALDRVTARGANRLANRLLAEVRQMFAFALVREFVARNPTEGVNKKNVGGQDTERERTLTEAEIKLLPAMLDTANLLDATKHAVWVMLATLARIGELTRARIEDIDLTAGTWVIPAEHAKNGRAHMIYLSDFARHHLAALLALTSSEVWLFPASRNDGAVCSKSITKQLYDRQRGKQKTKGTAQTAVLCLPGGRWVPHDLRRTGATLMGELGVQSDVIEKCLNHTEENKVKRTYQRAVRESEQRDAWRLLGDRLELLTRRDADNVFVMKTA